MSESAITTIGGRRNALAFWFGCVLVTVGVVLHVPMYLMGADMGYVLVGMPMDAEMLWGMALIVVGIGFAAFGLLPKQPPRHERIIETIAPPEDAPLTRAHWGMALLLALALIIDIMKPASLGFVTPGMRAEYQVGKAMVAWLPLAALTGTVIGSFVWGALADIYGRRAAILLSSIVFIGTSICGAMPDFWWNVFMCLLMGAGAGGMLPVAYALLAEIMPTRHRGWMLVLIGGIGAVGGYFAASFLSELLQPVYSWRIMWFLNLPTGLLLVAMSPLLPESARFLQQMGRGAEARAMLARFGAVAHKATEEEVAADTDHGHVLPVQGRFLGSMLFPGDRDRSPGLSRRRPHPWAWLRSTRRAAAVAAEPTPDAFYAPGVGITAALTLGALAWGLVNFGLLLWLPATLVEEGLSVAAASGLIAKSTLISIPVVAVATWLYARWSSKYSLVLMMGMMAAGLVLFLLRGAGGDPVFALTFVIVGSSGVISILLPYTAENYPLRVRARATGWVAGCSKLGGLMAQGLSVAGAVPGFGVAAAMIAVPTVGGLLLVVWLGRETKGRDLRELERVRAG